MTEHWISLKDIPASGREFSFSDQNHWISLWHEFDLRVKPGRDLVAVVLAVPQGKGVLLSGSLKGSVVVPCSRCAKDVEQDIDVAFEQYEEPGIEADEVGGEPLTRLVDGDLELDMGRLLWEQFLLNLPPRTLCAPGCKGLCPGCGADLNEGPCKCDTDEGDPRMSALRGLKIDRK